MTSFETARRNAYRLLGDAQDALRSDWAPGTGSTPEQAAAATAARQAIAHAKSELNRAAR